MGNRLINGFIGNFLLFPLVKKWKSVKIWRSYRLEFGGTLFGTHCREIRQLKRSGETKNDKATMGVPDDGGGKQIPLVGEGRDGRLAEYYICQHDAGEAHEHRREPAGQRVLARKHLRVFNQQTTTYTRRQTGWCIFQSLVMHMNDKI